jgi:hypothetical protein
MTRRLRMLLPPRGVLLGLALVYVLLESPFWFIRLRWGVVVAPDGHPSGLLLIVAAVAYGAYRAIGFHPHFRPGYREWLERTPWTHHKPLPAGPAGWVWEDVLMLGLLAAWAWANRFPDPAQAVTLALMSYGLILTVSFFPTGAWAYGYASALALGLPVWLWPGPRASLVAAAAANLIVRAGLGRSLANFPWPPAAECRWWDTLGLEHGLKSHQSSAVCGWPYDRFFPRPSEQKRIDLADAALLGLLAGWWAFVPCSLIAVPNDRTKTLDLILTGGTGGLVGFRWLLYRAGHAPPIGLWARIATGRWIIPGYDRIFVGPALTLLIPWSCIYAFGRMGIPTDVALPAGLALMVFIALASPPSLKSWRLTGKHRLVPGFTSAQNGYIQIG